MTKATTLEQIGSWVFIAGIIISILIGIMAPTSNLWMAILIALGLIVGIVNVTDKEVDGFILASVGLIVGAAALINLTALLSFLGGWFEGILNMFISFVSGAIFFPALRRIYDIARNK
ncbi:hypothetical protein J7J90_01675 [Candidatus Micrarchaeota archaeon]|nr:hypothetical protein [Candidatus Micrarchaeota archaeon]